MFVYGKQKPFAIAANPGEILSCQSDLWGPIPNVYEQRGLRQSRIDKAYTVLDADVPLIAPVGGEFITLDGHTRLVESCRRKVFIDVCILDSSESVKNFRELINSTITQKSLETALLTLSMLEEGQLDRLVANANSLGIKTIKDLAIRCGYRI